MTGDVKTAFKEALRNKMLHGAWIRRDLSRLLVALANYDVKTNIAIIKITRSIIVCLLLSVIVSFFFAVFGVSGDIWYLPEALFLGFLVSWLLSYRYGRMDIQDDLPKFLLPFFRLISGDIMKNSKVALKMNLENIRARKYSKGVDQLPKKGRYYEITSEKFERESLSMAARLNDGNGLWVERFERLTVINKKQTNANGKYKSKTKQKRTVKTIVSLSVNPKLYSLKEPSKIAKEGGMQMKEEGERPIISMTFIEKGDLNAGMEPNVCVNAICRMYSLLKAPEERKAKTDG